MKNERTGFVYVKPGCNNGRSKVKYNKAGWLFLDYYVKVRVLVKSVVYMAFKKNGMQRAGVFSTRKLRSRCPRGAQWQNKITSILLSWGPLLYGKYVARFL